MSFELEYKKLNDRQKEAVDAIDGPVLVIAGPGTGKTQLLSARVANILTKTDTLAQNILCLTFTESGALNMRERLSRFIGQEAYNVTIGTYHAFGGDLIRRFPEYFGKTRLQSPIDELMQFEVISNIVEAMSYQNPLKQTRHHLKDLISTLSELKRALLSSDDVRALATENFNVISAVNSELPDIFSGFTTMPRKVETALGYFAPLVAILEKASPQKPYSTRLQSTAHLAKSELTLALSVAEETNKTSPLTSWKNKWLVKNAQKEFAMEGTLQTKRLEALADVLEAYQSALEEKGLFDFDDMILRSIIALEEYADLKYTLQEQYQYILLDEFQDTNAAQFRIIELLTDNPVHEGRPNVLAVGDDDQAIYAFQGAHYSNMVDFYNLYKDTAVIHLTENYRSHSDILHTAKQIAEQIEERLSHQFENMDKHLIAKNDSLPQEATLMRQEFLSDVAQNSWIATEIATLIKNGVKPSAIAVIAPRHKQLEPIVPHLQQLAVPLRYERREDILETPTIRQLTSMSNLVLALHNNDQVTADAYWPEVLSFEFWKIPVSTIWKVSWEVGDSYDNTNWSELLLQHSELKPVGLLFLSLALQASQLTAEEMLDSLTGSCSVTTNEPDVPEVSSSFKAFYASRETMQNEPELFYETLSHLTVIRTKLREHQATQEIVLRIADFVKMIELYQNAQQRMTNTSPYNQAAEAVQLTTVFKAKGLEYEYVFLPSVQDEVWGASARGGSNKLTLPLHMAPIRHAGASDDERLRIFFVAITRAKSGLYLTSHQKTYAGKTTKRLKYLNEQEQEDGSFKTLTLPESKQTNLMNDNSVPQLEAVENNWRSRHMQSIPDRNLNHLLAERLQTYQLSPTHLNSFIDTEYGGPEAFFFNTILRFPSAPGVDGQFGNAIHETLHWLQDRVNSEGSLPTIALTLDYFDKRLRMKHLSPETEVLQQERGHHALTTYLKNRSHIFKSGDEAERNFKNEGVMIDTTHLAGKVDRLEVDKDTKTIVVVDYKTGKSYEKWNSELKLHKYRQQLYCYKLLIEGSHTYRGYTVTSGRLEFIESDQSGNVHALELTFDPNELERVKKLLGAMWTHVMNLDFPDISQYEKNLKGAKQLEDDLISHVI